jgi:hypothetical protein
MILILIALSAFPEGESSSNPDAQRQVEEMLGKIKGQFDPANSPLSQKDLATAAELGRQIGMLDWLGPLAPVALSPFFGITCLSGLAIWGPDWLPGKNTLLASPVLQNPAVFTSFLILTVLTSLPRLTKVSKPFVQAVDRLEAYAAIIVLIVVKFMGNATGSSTVDEPLAAGLGSFSMDLLLCFAAGLNVLVINAIKFFFEMLIWLIPFPMIDAMFEAANKTLCAALMTLYAFSPLMATLVNLLLFAASAVVFRWVYRRLTYYREMLSEPLLTRLLGPKGGVERIVLFPLSGWEPFPARAKLALIKDAEEHTRIVWWRWPLACAEKTVTKGEGTWQICSGWFSSEIVFKTGTETVFFSTPWKSKEQLELIAQRFGMEIVDRSSINMPNVVYRFI